MGGGGWGGGWGGVERQEVGKGENAAIREKRQGNTNHKHHIFQYLMKNSMFITLGIITFGVKLNA